MRVQVPLEAFEQRVKVQNFNVVSFEEERKQIDKYFQEINRTEEAHKSFVERALKDLENIVLLKRKELI